MAIGDVGFLTPAESQYYSPGAYDDMLRAESSKMASYLAQMDMFYENLSETQREFDLTYELKEEALKLEAERVEIDKGYLEDTELKTQVWKEVELGKLSMAQEELEFRKEQEKERLKLEQERLGLSKEEMALRERQIDEQFSLEREKMAQSHEEFMSNQDFNKWAAEQEMTLNKDRLAIEERGADLAEKQYEYEKLLKDKEFETKFGSSPEDYGEWGFPSGASDFYKQVAGAGSAKKSGGISDSTAKAAIESGKELGLAKLESEKDIAEMGNETLLDIASLSTQR